MLRCRHRTGDLTVHFEREVEGQERGRGRYEGSKVS